MLSVERGLLGGGRPGPRPGRPTQIPAASRFDPVAIVAVAVLAGLGLANLAALGDRSVVRHQLVVDAAGVALFLVLLRWRSEGLRWLGWGCYVLSLLLLMAVDVLGSTVNGARRWLDVGSFTMQPSELAKLGLLLVLAQVLGSDRSWPRRLVTALVVAALPIALVVTEPDLSTAAVLCAVTASMLVLGRIPLKALALILGAAVMVLPFGEHLLHPYQQERLHSFLSGSTSVNGSGWAILQMHVALGWGGLTGGAGNPLHRLVALYLPERETDLAFASLVEQHGIVAGSLAVLAAAVLRLAGRRRQPPRVEPSRGVGRGRLRGAAERRGRDLGHRQPRPDPDRGGALPAPQLRRYGGRRPHRHGRPGAGPARRRGDPPALEPPEPGPAAPPAGRAPPPSP